MNATISEKEEKRLKSPLECPSATFSIRPSRTARTPLIGNIHSNYIHPVPKIFSFNSSSSSSLANMRHTRPQLPRQRIEEEEELVKRCCPLKEMIPFDRPQKLQSNLWETGNVTGIVVVVAPEEWWRSDQIMHCNIVLWVVVTGAPLVIHVVIMITPTENSTRWRWFSPVGLLVFHLNSGAHLGRKVAFEIFNSWLLNSTVAAVHVIKLFEEKEENVRDDHIAFLRLSLWISF